MLAIIDEIRWIWSYARRSRNEPRMIRSLIEAEGGVVHSSRQLGTFKRSPFRGLRPYPILYEFVVQYGRRRGRWYVRTWRGSDSYDDWVWSDDHDYDDLPVERAGAVVDNDAVPVGYLANTMAVMALIAIGLVVGIAIFWFFF